MKKFLINLLCCCMAMITAMACKGDEELIDGGIPPVFLRVHVCDIENVDLLDPQNEEALWNGDWAVIWNGNDCKLATDYVEPNFSNVIGVSRPSENVPGYLVFPLIKWNGFEEVQGSIVISWNGGEETTEITYDVSRLRGATFSESYTVNGQPMESSPYECMLSIVKE